jgi:hypothetical protein
MGFFLRSVIRMESTCFLFSKNRFLVFCEKLIFRLCLLSTGLGVGDFLGKDDADDWSKCRKRREVFSFSVGMKKLPAGIG